MICISQAFNQRVALKDVEMGKNSDSGKTRTQASHVHVSTYLVAHVQNLHANDRTCVNSLSLKYISIIRIKP